MKQQEWTETTVTECAIWDCGRLLKIGWALRWHEIDGDYFAICQTGHGTTIQARQVLIEQAWLEQDTARALRKIQKNPTD